MRAPSAILIVRHGARLDAADANWHLTSPAPYDPPLTYGGWNQAKALGSRIAHILSARAAQNAAKNGKTNGSQSGNAADQAPPKKKQKVVIHTSPFLRCLQTSVAISAGMAQTLERPVLKRGRGHSRRSSGNRYDSAPDGRDYSIKKTGLATPDQTNIKTTLRVDAFLGEWLTPEYFERITPPPSSTMMVASAKAILLRGEPMEVYTSNKPKPGFFPGGWSPANAISTTTSIASEDTDISVDTMSLMVPLHKQRSSSAHSSGEKSSERPVFSELRPSRAAYNPPVPAYAIGPSEPLPRGYCTHARDSCVDLDLLWDSMRLPQDWGDGGQLGEEWSAMHKRFRRGVYKMVEWYKRHTPDYHPDREDPLALDHELTDEEDDDEYDLTVILVTHAAGCNALVGALTDHPVLHDFGLTSLSMLVKKGPESRAASPMETRSPFSRRESLPYSGLSEKYELQIMSSTQHLRAGMQSTNAAALTSPHLVPQIPAYASLSHHAISSSNSSGNGKIAVPSRGSMSAALGSIRRPSLGPSSLYLEGSSVDTSRRSSMSGGLWSRTSTISTADDVPAISIGASAASLTSPTRQLGRPVSPTNSERGAKLEDDHVPPLPSNTSSQRGGLWSSSPQVRASRPKRRWTITEHDDNMEQWDEPSTKF